MKRNIFERIIRQLHSSNVEYIDNIFEYHGIAFDEIKRAKNSRGNIKYPLVEWEITEKQALDYCYSKGFDWGGLYETMARVSCWCCPLSRMGEFKALHDNFPEL